jgi:hypothetical protein
MEMKGKRMIKIENKEYLSLIEDRKKLRSLYDTEDAVRRLKELENEKHKEMITRLQKLYKVAVDGKDVMGGMEASRRLYYAEIADYNI